MSNPKRLRRTWLAGGARLAATAPFYALGLATMSVSVAARGFVVGAAAGVLLAGVAAGSVPGPLPGVGYLAIAVLIGTLAFAGLVGKARRTLRTRIRLHPAVLLLGARSPGTDEERRVQALLGRLARQVDLPVPETRIVRSERPVCFTVGYPDDEPPARLVEETLGVRLARGESSGEGVYGGPTPSAFADPVEADEVVVVSTGLLDRLSTPELEAVLAHELAHLRNDDLRLMNWLLLPIAWAESAVAATTGTDRGRGRRVARTARNLSKLVTLAVTIPGVALFNRGREYAADRGAAAMTGDPAHLASALESLDDAVDSSPVEDLRAAAVVNVVGGSTGGIPFAHPSTDGRIRRLRRMTAETASRN